MPVFYSPTPKNLHMGLASVSGSVFTNNRTGNFSSDYNREQDDKTLVTHLPLQMLLYFNIFQFPSLLVTGVVLLTICEITRLYLGYIGTLKEKVTEGNRSQLSLWNFLSGAVALYSWMPREAVSIRPLQIYQDLAVPLNIQLIQGED
uniref:Uncharacterized protein n=1 Tax=Oncorhynchus tshawytscha TaxID=74940 RepID=A0A8C8G1M8_ONCTS